MHLVSIIQSEMYSMVTAWLVLYFVSFKHDLQDFLISFITPIFACDIVSRLDANQ